LVHGLGDSAETWDRLLLDAPGAPFPKGVRAYAVNLPGTGGSAAPKDPEGYRIRELAGSLRAALEPVCSTWTVAGNSLGGWISAWLALDWPQGVGKLVLLASAGLADPTGVSERTARTLADPTPENLKEFSARASFKADPVPERAWAQFAERLRRRPTRAMVLAIRKEDFLDGRLADVKPPTAILWGDADGLIPSLQGEKFHAGIPGSSLSLLPRCGHLPQKECPEKVRSAVFGP
jgi:pimeloyl-ACP methyl ester carboxylesterase